MAPRSNIDTGAQDDVDASAGPDAKQENQQHHSKALLSPSTVLTMLVVIDMLSVSLVGEF